jgi:mono/diheme cytochrome c family protein
MKKVKKEIFILLFAFVLIIGITSCSKKETPAPKQESKNEQINTGAPSVELSGKGKEIFYLKSEKTGMMCADCHSDGTNSGDAHYKYFADVFNANKRPSTYFGIYKGEEVPKTAGGADLCWTRFLKMDNPLDAEQINALNAYYETVGKGKEIKEFKFTTIAVPKPDKVKLKEDQLKIAALTGNADNGEKMFNETCTFCHSGKSEVKHVPNLFKEFEGNLKSITYHIRLGSKHMPYFPYELINDQNIADIAAFIFKKNNMTPQ